MSNGTCVAKQPLTNPKPLKPTFLHPLLCRRVKAEHHVLLSDALTPDKLQALLGAVPSWLADASGNNTETLNWLNTMLAQV